MLTVLITLPTLPTSCDEIGGSRTEDTRQYIDTIGVVFTNEADDVINELYVFPDSLDGTDVFEQEMGPDLIKNTSAVRRVGSFGVTVDVVGTHYNVLARDRSQGVYLFQNVPLSNVSEAVLTFESINPRLTVRHKDGTTNVIEGLHITPGDAPDHTQVPMRRAVTVSITVQNDTDSDITFMSILEADNPDKGEVEAFIGTLEAGKSITIHIRLYEEDEAVTAWLLNIETADGKIAMSDEPFNIWEVGNLDISTIDGMLVYDAY